MNAEIWVTTEGTLTKIGFTRSFLERMTECWNILPVGKKFKKDFPLMMVETNDEVISVMSPVDGLINNFSDKALNFPDKLTETDVVVIMSSDRPASREIPQAAEPFNPQQFAINEARRTIRDRINAQLQNGAAPVPRAPVRIPPIANQQTVGVAAWNAQMEADAERWGARADVAIDGELEPF